MSCDQERAASILNGEETDLELDHDCEAEISRTTMNAWSLASGKYDDEVHCSHSDT